MKIINQNQLNELSINIANKIDLDDCIFLFGEIGVGKTTFARYLINNLQKKKGLKLTEVTSPTFNLLYEYDIKDIKIMHYDLYRVKKSNELDQLGIFLDDNDTIKIIEWPELIKTPLKHKLEIYIDYGKKNNEREIKMIGFGKWKKFENEF